MISTFQKIKKIREYKDFTRQAIADHLDISLSGYSKLEQGKVDISISKLELIADFLNVNTYELIKAKTDDQLAKIVDEDPIDEETEYKALLKQVECQDKLIELMNVDKEKMESELKELKRVNKNLKAEIGTSKLKKGQLY